MDQKSMRKLDVNKEAENIGRFWKRLLASLIDCILLFPWAIFWSNIYHRESFFIIGRIMIVLSHFLLFILFVRIFKGTPGKLILRLRIVKINGDKISFKETFLRDLVSFIIVILVAVLFIWTYSNNPQLAEMKPLGIFIKNLKKDSMPYYNIIQLLSSLFWIADVIVFLANKRNRALHDFIAGTIVVNSRAKQR